MPVVELSAWIKSIESSDIVHNFLFQRYPLRYLLNCNFIGWKYKQFLFVKIQDNDSVSGSAYKNLIEWKYLAERQK